MEAKLIDAKEKNDNDEVVYRPLTNGKQELLVAEKVNGKKDTWFLYFCVFTVNLLTFVGGCGFVWSSPAIPTLKSSDPNVNPLGAPITPLQESWIASLPPLGGAIGPVLIGKFADKYGRKKALILVTVLEMICYVVLAYTSYINLYYVTRLLLGVGAGMTYTILPSYVGESCEEHNRGKFSCIIGIFAALGILYVIAVGPLLTLRLFTLSCAAPLVFLMICLVLVIPETPVFLASVGKTEEAKRALLKLRHESRDAAEKDLLEILHIIEETSKTSKGGYMELFQTLALRKALVITVGLCSLQQFSGVNAILAFIGPVFSLTGGEIPANISSIIVVTVKVVGVVVASVVVEKLGRKYLMLMSTLSCAISLVVLSIYFYLKQAEFHYLQSIFWLPISSLIIFVFMYNIGLGPVPWALVSEIFPSHLKATAASVVTTFGAFSAFVVMFLFPILIEYLGPANCFCVFGGFCVLGGVFIYFGVPETRGKNIVEIQKILSKTGK